MSQQLFQRNLFALACTTLQFAAALTYLWQGNFTRALYWAACGVANIAVLL